MPTPAAESVLRSVDPDTGVVTLTLNRPGQRNAMTPEFFDAFDHRLDEVETDHDAPIVIITGAGPAFCAGFDLARCVDDPAMLQMFIERLSQVTRRVRRLDGPVIAAVHGHALAGGCALVSACDFSVVAPDALLGYPVHRIGVSPAVTLPTLMPSIGFGAARWLTMGGRLISGSEAFERRLVTHCSPVESACLDVAGELAATLSSHGRHALRVTKAWLNELEDADDDGRFDRPVAGSIGLAMGDESASMLRAFWESRRSSR